MAFAFDTLGYAKKLRDSGVPADQAEAHAEAARQFIMTELVTRSDLDTATTILRQEIASVRKELQQEMAIQTLRLTVRLGIMLAAGLSILAAIQRLH
jgi:hypothetical protein